MSNACNVCRSFIRHWFKNTKEQKKNTTNLFPLLVSDTFVTSGIFHWFWFVNWFIVDVQKYGCIMRRSFSKFFLYSFVISYMLFLQSICSKISSTWTNFYYNISTEFSFYLIFVLMFFHVRFLILNVSVCVCVCAQSLLLFEINWLHESILFIYFIELYLLWPPDDLNALCLLVWREREREREIEKNIWKSFIEYCFDIFRNKIADLSKFRSLIHASIIL